jgi:translation initiation factor IF-3
LEVLIQAKHKDVNFKHDLTYKHHHIKSYLTTKADDKLLLLQKVRLASCEDASRRIVFHIKGKISDICEKRFIIRMSGILFFGIVQSV